MCYDIAWLLMISNGKRDYYGFCKNSVFNFGNELTIDTNECWLALIRTELVNNFFELITRMEPSVNTIINY